VKLYLKYYVVFDHDTSTSWSHCQFCGIYGINDLQSRLQVIRGCDFGTNQKWACDFLLDIDRNLSPILPCVRDIRSFLYAKSQFFDTPSLIQRKYWGVPHGVDPWCWGLQTVNTPG